MTDGDMIRFIREEIRKEMNVILSGETAGSATHTESIDNLFPGMPTITDRPVMQPFGISSRAPKKTLQFIGRQGADKTNRFVLGHRDKNKPAVDEGETSVYSVGGYQVRVFNGKIQIAKGTDFETLVVGETLRDFLIALIGEIVLHTHAAPGAPPTNASAFTALQTASLDNDKILAKDGGRF